MMSREPGAARRRMAQQFIEDPDARARRDDVRMKRELEQSARLAGRVELAQEYVEYIGRCEMRSRRTETVHQEIGRIVADPFDRQFGDAAFLAIEQ